LSGRYQRKDHLYNRAKDEGYRSRAAYKLMELNDRFKFLRSGAAVLDLGCFPGGWLQVACELVGAKGIVVGVDLREVPPFSAKDIKTKPGAAPLLPKVIVGDITTAETQQALAEISPSSFNVVLSDLSPHISGIKERDIAGSLELVQLAYLTAQKFLRDSGTFVAKIFPSPETDALFKELTGSFAKLQRVGLDSTRKTSNEYYFVGTGYRRHNN